MRSLEPWLETAQGPSMPQSPPLLLPSTPTPPPICRHTLLRPRKNCDLFKDKGDPQGHVVGHGSKDGASCTLEKQKTRVRSPRGHGDKPGVARVRPRSCPRPGEKQPPPHLSWLVLMGAPCTALQQLLPSVAGRASPPRERPKRSHVGSGHAPTEGAGTRRCASCSISETHPIATPEAGHRYRQAGSGAKDGLPRLFLSG